MATYYVSTSGSDTADGSSGSPWKTIGRAAQTTGTPHVQSGDTVRIAPGVYEEAVLIATPNTTWRVDGDGSDPVIIDGGWGPSLFNSSMRLPLPNWTALPISGQFVGMVRIQAAGVVLDGISEYGIVIRNSGGRGIQIVNADNVEVRYVKTDFTASGAGYIGKSDNVVVEDCAFIRQGMINWAGRNAGQGFTTDTADGTTIQRCLFLFSGGETIDIDIFSTNTIVQDCEVGPGDHPKIYNIGAQDTIIRRNIVWDDPTGPDISTSPAIAVGDERDRLTINSASPSDNVQIYNNIVVGCKRGIGILGNADNYIWSSTRIYVGYNTVICADWSVDGLFANASGGAGQEHSGLFENNLIYSLTGQSPSRSTGTSGSPDVEWRNNAWQTAPQTACQGTGDVTGNPVLRLEERDYLIPSLGVRLNRIDMPLFSFRDEIETLLVGKPLASSSVVDAASNGSAAGGVTPPTITTDFYGNSRGTAPDIGAIQHGISEPPSGTLVASFTQSATSGTVPLTVTFTDTSTSSAGTVNYRLWTFGDGTTSTAANPVKTYSTPGIYTPALVVRDSTGLEDDASGSAITVSADAPVGASRTYDIKAFDLPTSTGSFDIALDNLDGETPNGIIILWSRGTTVNTPANGGLFGWGMATETTQHAYFGASDDNVTTSNTGARMATDAVILTGTGSAAVNGKASLTSFSADTATINVTDAFPGAYKAVAIAICGQDAPVHLQPVSLGNNGTTATHNVPFAAAVALLTSNFAPTAGGPGNDISWGAASSYGSAVTSWRDIDASNPTALVAYSATGQVARKYFGAYAEIQGDMNNTVTYKVTGANMNEVASSLAFGISGASVGQVILPDTETDYSFDTGNEPGLVILWGSRNAESGVTDYGAGKNDLFWAIAATSAVTGGVVTGSDDNQSPSNTFSLTTNKFKLYDGDGSTVIVEGDIVLTASGFALDLTTASGSDLVINYLALPVSAGVPTGEPILGYEVLPREVDAGDALTFTNLSAANGATIISSLVDWGDGVQTILSGSTATHSYGDAGDYTVTLIVNLDDGREYRLPRPGIIRVTGSLAEWRIEAPRPHPDGITRTSINKLYEDPRTDGRDYGYFTLELNLDGIPTDYNPDPIPPAMPGKLVWYSDPANGGISFVRPDGARATLALTFSGGGETGGGTSLATPTGFSVPATDADGDFTISWNSVSGATSYIIQEANLTAGMRELTTTNTSYAITGRTAGDWYYRVAARAASGEATISSPYTTQQVCDVGGSSTTTIERSVAASTDDSWQGSGTFNDTSYIAHTLDAAGERAGLRFLNVTIPQGSTIVSATLDVHIRAADDPNLSIKGEDIDDAPTFASSSNNIGARTLTAASVTWSDTNLGTGVVTSPDIATVIQEIVDRAGWASGNDLVLVLTANTGCDFVFASYDNSDSQPAPKLTVEYS